MQVGLIGISEGFQKNPLFSPRLRAWRWGLHTTGMYRANEQRAVTEKRMAPSGRNYLSCKIWQSLMLLALKLLIHIWTTDLLFKHGNAQAHTYTSTHTHTGAHTPSRMCTLGYINMCTQTHTRHSNICPNVTKFSRELRRDNMEESPPQVSPEDGTFPSTILRD